MPDDNNRAPSTGKTAGLFDLRVLIAALFGVYGVVLTVMGAAGASQKDLDKAGGWNVNLWCGIAMLVVTAAFGAWAMLRPVRIPDPAAPAEDTPDTPDTPDQESQPA